MNLECDCKYYVSFKSDGTLSTDDGEGDVYIGTCPNPKCGNRYQVVIFPKEK